VPKKPPQDETDLFRQSIGKVTPVKSDNIVLSTAKKPKPYPKAQNIDIEANFKADATHEIEALQQEDIIRFSIPGVQKNTLKKLRKGQFGIDAEIDLHGLNSREAKQQLLRFLYSCVEEGVRCAHIIHGKGYGSTDKMPILKNNLNLWLRQHQEVLAFCSSPPKHGGAGALHVLLRLAEKYREQEDT
jgi:DNA-nicking Smr family endonuclease